MPKSKIITYVVVAGLVLIGLYWVYQRFTETSAPVTGGVVAVANTGVNLTDTNNSQASQFIGILNDIDNIDLQNRLILNNKIFTSLQDFGRPIEERALGRANPFAPFSGGEGAGIIKKSTTTTATSTE